MSIPEDVAGTEEFGGKGIDAEGNRNCRLLPWAYSE